MFYSVLSVMKSPEKILEQGDESQCEEALLLALCELSLEIFSAAVWSRRKVCLLHDVSEHGSSQGAQQNVFASTHIYAVYKLLSLNVIATIGNKSAFCLPVVHDLLGLVGDVGSQLCT